jgi:hypothetical protein
MNMTSDDRMVYAPRSEPGENAHLEWRRQRRQRRQPHTRGRCFYFSELAANKEHITEKAQHKNCKGQRPKKSTRENLIFLNFPSDFRFPFLQWERAAAAPRDESE